MHLAYIFKGFIQICAAAGFYFLLIQLEKWYLKQKAEYLDYRFESLAPHSEKDVRKCHLTQKDTWEWRKHFLFKLVPWAIVFLFACWMTGQYGFSWIMNGSDM